MGRARDLANILSSSGNVALDSELGLSLITPTSIAATGGSGSISSTGAVSFTSASAISLNGVFSSTYTNYRIMFHATGASGNASITYRLRKDGSDASGSNYYRAGTFNYNNSSTISPLNASGTSFNLVDILAAAPNRTFLTIEASQTNNATETMHTFFSAAQNSTSSYAFQGMGLHDLTIAYDGFTILFSATSSGTVSVYGYRK